MTDPDDPGARGGAADPWPDSGEPGPSFDRAVLQAVEAALELPMERRRRYLDSEAALDPPSKLRALALLAECEVVEAEDAARNAGVDGGSMRGGRDDAGPLAIDLSALLRAADWEAGGTERLRPGAMLGHYRIERFIAAGGMGEVYEATDSRIGRRVAIKTLPRFADPERAQRFMREARIMARLEHPSIARLYEWGAPDRSEGGYPFIVMEFVEGSPLREAVAAIRSAGGDAVDIVRLVLPVVDAVAHAHARGVLHRDIKPGNILVDRSGSARLLDFGVAAILESEEVAAGTLTEAGAPGTLNYMSPEHVRGGASRVTVRSDIYGLGLVLYESIAGRPAVEAGGRGIAEVIEAVVRADPPALALREVASGSDLDFIVRRALRKDPAERSASADALAEDLRRVRAGEAPLGRDLGTLRVLRGLARRNRRGIAIGAGVLAGAAVAVYFGASQFVRAREAEARAEVIVGELLLGSKPLIADLHQRLLREDQPLAARRAALEATVEYLDWVLGNAPQDDRVRIEVARHYRALGRVAGSGGDNSLGDTAAASAFYLRSLAILDGLLEGRGSAGRSRDLDARVETQILLERSNVLREYAGILDFGQRAPFFARANEDQVAALALMPEGEERVKTERYLLFTALQRARLENDPDGFAAPLAGLLRIASAPGQATNAELFSEIGLGERYHADVLEEAGRFEEAVEHARAAMEALERSVALGQDEFTNRRHLARVQMLIASRTCAERPVEASADMLLAALELSRGATNLQPSNSFYRQSHVESAVMFARAARVVAEHARDASDRDGATAVVGRSLAAIDEHLAFIQALPTEGAPHRNEPRWLADLAAAREALAGVVEPGAR